jgi:hypothetical protein
VSAKLTPAQQTALRTIQRRDWPAGEPRADWIHKGTLEVIERLGLAKRRPNTTGRKYWDRSPILDLTPAGRSALGNAASGRGRAGTPSGAPDAELGPGMKNNTLERPE